MLCRSTSIHDRSSKNNVWLVVRSENEHNFQRPRWRVLCPLPLPWLRLVEIRVENVELFCAASSRDDPRVQCDAASHPAPELITSSLLGYGQPLQPRPEVPHWDLVESRRVPAPFRRLEDERAASADSFFELREKFEGLPKGCRE